MNKKIISQDSTSSQVKTSVRFYKQETFGKWVALNADQKAIFQSFAQFGVENLTLISECGAPMFTVSDYELEKLHEIFKWIASRCQVNNFNNPFIKDLIISFYTNCRGDAYYCEFSFNKTHKFQPPIKIVNDYYLDLYILLHMGKAKLVLQGTNFVVLKI